jgi:hypothetical protein
VGQNFCPAVAWGNACGLGTSVPKVKVGFPGSGGASPNSPHCDEFSRRTTPPPRFGEAPPQHKRTHCPKVSDYPSGSGMLRPCIQSDACPIRWIYPPPVPGMFRPNRECHSRDIGRITPSVRGMLHLCLAGNSHMRTSDYPDSGRGSASVRFLTGNRPVGLPHVQPHVCFKQTFSRFAPNPGRNSGQISRVRPMQPFTSLGILVGREFLSQWVNRINWLNMFTVGVPFTQREQKQFLNN